MIRGGEQMRIGDFSSVSTTNDTMKKRLFKTFLYSLPLLIVALLYVGFWVLNGSGWPCAFRLFTGWYCPSCGAGRMFISLLKFDFYQAFRYNPLIMICLPVLFGIFARYQIAYLRDKKITMSKIELAFFILLVVALAIFGILRNIPQFSFLAPTEISPAILCLAYCP
jgi:hypothetical protein